jgi:RHS repeat-associated protein
LPEIIQFKNGNQIRNKYNAAGQKLSSRNITVDAGVYQPLNPGDIILNIDVNENDNVTVEGMDYLGNNRELWRASYTWGSTTHAAATVQRTQYYPSGLPWKYNSGDNPGSQPYKYNGKEFVEMHGLDEYDSEARWYYPAIMRTTTMDPLAEKYYDISPYAWCGNNPVVMVDPDGMELRYTFKNKDAFDAFYYMLQQIQSQMFSGQFQFALVGNKEKLDFRLDIIASENGGDVSKLSDQGSAFYGGMKKMIDDKNAVSEMEIYNNSSKVNYVDVINQKLDVGDIMNSFYFNSNYTTVTSFYAHETMEQYQKAKAGYKKGEPTWLQNRAYDINHPSGTSILEDKFHPFAIEFENRISTYIRTGNVLYIPSTKKNVTRTGNRDQNGKYIFK